MNRKSFARCIIKKSSKWVYLVLVSLLGLIFSTPTVATVKISDGFNYPVGPRTPGFVTEANDGDGWFNAQDFGDLNDEIRPGFDLLHAGEDWNGECVFETGDPGCDSAEPVYAVSHGEVIEIRDLGAIGEVLVLRHSLTDGSTIYSVYLHIDVNSGLQVGDEVARDQKVGRIADITSSGLFPHLHFELRTEAIVPGDLYINDFDNSGYYASQADLEADGFTVDPSDFIDANRPFADTPHPVDVYFLVDLSSSFADDLPVFKAQAPEVISTLKASSPNIRFGLGKYEDYPINPFGSVFFGDKAYEQLTDLTFDTDLVLVIIDSLFTRFGGDLPQSQLTALFQAATGAGQDLSGAGFPGASIPPGQQANFRDGAVKLFLLWTDAPFHRPGDLGDIPYPGPSFNETVNAILALDPPKVLGISSGTDAIPDLEAIAAATDSFAPPGGVDCNGDGIIDIFEGEPLVCSISFSGEGIGDAILATIEAALESPIAEAGGPYDGTVGSPVTFDASGSFDPDGEIISYEWDFEDDGIFDETTTSAIISHTYDEEFSGIAFLRVTDNDGLSAIDIASVEVIAPSNGGGGIGCSIAHAGTPISIPIYILLPIFLVIMRAWKYCKKD